MFNPVGCRNIEVDIPTGLYTYSESTRVSDDLQLPEFQQVCSRNSNSVPLLLQKNNIARNSLLMNFIALKDTFSSRQCVPVTGNHVEALDAVLCGAPARRPHSISEWSRLQNFAKRHSPQFYLHEKEEYFPTDPHIHALKSDLILDGKTTPHLLNLTSLAAKEEFHKMFSNAKERAFFKLKNVQDRKGQQPRQGSKDITSPVFTDILVRDKDSIVTLQYSMFFAYNGAATVSLNTLIRDHQGKVVSSVSLDNLISLAPMNEHEGDWVTVDVHVDVISDVILGVTLWRYSGTSKRNIHTLQSTFQHEQLTPIVIPKQDLLFSKDGQLTLYISQNTHRVYTKASSHQVYQSTLKCNNSPASVALQNSISMQLAKNNASTPGTEEKSDVLISHNIVDSTGTGYEWNSAHSLVFVRSPLFIGTEYYVHSLQETYNHTSHTHESTAPLYTLADGEEWVRKILGTMVHGLEKWKLTQPGKAEVESVDLPYVMNVYNTKTSFLFQYSTSMEIQSAVHGNLNKTTPSTMKLTELKPTMLEAPYAPWWTYTPIQWSNNDEQTIAEGSSRNVVVPYALKLCSRKLLYSKIDQVVGNIIRSMPFLKRSTVEPAIALYFAWVCSSENHLYKQMEAEEGIVAHNAPSAITQVLQEVVSGAYPPLAWSVQEYLQKKFLNSHEHDGLLLELLGKNQNTTNGTGKVMTCYKHQSDLKEQKWVDKNLSELLITPELTKEKLIGQKSKVDSMVSQTTTRLHTAKTNEQNVKKNQSTLQLELNGILSSIDGVSTAIHGMTLEKQQNSVEIVKMEETEKNQRAQAVQKITSAKTDEERKMGGDQRTAANDYVRKKEDLKRNIQHLHEELASKKIYKKQQLLAAKVKEESMKSVVNEVKRAQRQKQVNSRLLKLSEVLSLRATLLLSSTMNVEEQCKGVEPEEEQKLQIKQLKWKEERLKTEAEWVVSERTRLRNQPDIVTSHTLGNAREHVEESMKKAIELQNLYEAKLNEVQVSKAQVTELEKKYTDLQEADSKDDVSKVIEEIQKQLVESHVKVGQKQGEAEEQLKAATKIKEEVRMNVSNVDDLTGKVDIEKRQKEQLVKQQEVWKAQYLEEENAARAEMHQHSMERKKQLYNTMNQQLLTNRNMLLNLEDAHTQSFLLKNSMEDSDNELKMIIHKLSQLHTLAEQSQAKQTQLQIAGKQALDKTLMHKALSTQKTSKLSTLQTKLDQSKDELSKLQNQLQLHVEAKKQKSTIKDKNTDVSHLLLTPLKVKEVQTAIVQHKADHAQWKKDIEKLTHENAMLNEDSKGSQAYLHNMQQSVQETSTKLDIEKKQIKDLEVMQQALQSQIQTNTLTLKKLQNKALLLQSRCEQAVAAKP